MLSTIYRFKIARVLFQLSQVTPQWYGFFFSLSLFLLRRSLFSSSLFFASQKEQHRFIVSSLSCLLLSFHLICVKPSWHSSATINKWHTSDVRQKKCAQIKTKRRGERPSRSRPNSNGGTLCRRNNLKTEKTSVLRLVWFLCLRFPELSSVWLECM